MTISTHADTSVDPALFRSRLMMSGINKTFGRNAVLTDAGIEVLPGEIHGLLGQNGSGKSTLIKILSGLYRPDGEDAVIRVDGTDVVQPITPVGVMSQGVTIIHQSLGLIPGHSVTENIRLGTLSGRRFGRFIDWSYEREQARLTLERMQSDIDPDRLVDLLHVGQRATVAIARALQVIVPGSGCVVLDESTQSLSREVLPEFYGTIRQLARQGTSIVLVSHRLDEVLTLADRVTILRDGRVTAAGVATHGMSEAQLSKEILGRQLIAFNRVEKMAIPDAEPFGAREPAVRLRGVTGEVLRGVDIDVHAGEVVGVIGATEAGHEELPYVITGAHSSTAAGSIEIHTAIRDLAELRVSQSLADGVVLVPTDRAGQGLALGETAISNVSLPRVRDKSRHGILRAAWQKEEFSAACAMLNISPPDPDQLAASFSGGNQQKLLLAKWLLQKPRFFVLHEPTQAVDVGARADILRAISAIAAEGVPVLVSSIEAEDLSLICDRIIVLQDGQNSRELTRPFTPEQVQEAIG
ncbi:sugar ABC transporter ATP-binding protein [Lacisediminihabitans profunda]|nr:sugar ABC transporter ATP-binding protein [Lacisediminihabitans profunda]